MSRLELTPETIAEHPHEKQHYQHPRVRNKWKFYTKSRTVCHIKSMGGVVNFLSTRTKEIRYRASYKSDVT